MLFVLACTAPAPTPDPGPRVWGQWVWTEADLAPLAEARAARAVTAGVHVATVHFRDGGFQTELGLPPTIAEGTPAVVIRLDDDVHAAWATMDDETLAAALTAPLLRVLTMVRARVTPVEVQLDYDVPVRLLPRWAAVLGRMRPALGPTPLWITSLVAHLREPAYGGLFAPVVAGHVLQVFDTGDDPATAAEVGALATRAGVPYRLGVGAFERAGTHHRDWFSHLDAACVAPACDTVWVFSAGRPWSGLALELP